MISAIDLTKDFPRSPKQKMAGLVHLPRMIDKARSLKQKILGEYIYPCPLDKIILSFTRIDSDDFINKVESMPDEEIGQWVKEKISNRSESEIHFINQQILDRKPDSEDRIIFFNEIRDKIDPLRTDIVTWVDLLDLEENHT